MQRVDGYELFQVENAAHDDAITHLQYRRRTLRLSEIVEEVLEDLGDDADAFTRPRTINPDNVFWFLYSVYYAVQAERFPKQKGGSTLEVDARPLCEPVSGDSPGET